jgi:hypothetical protein
MAEGILGLPSKIKEKRNGGTRIQREMDKEKSMTRAGQGKKKNEKKM